MDFYLYLSTRLAQVEAYLQKPSSCRLVSLGRVLEIESLAFSFRNDSLITGVAYDQFDRQCEYLRRFHNLQGSKSDFLSGKPYNGRFLPHATGFVFDDFDESQPGHPAQL